MNIYENRKNKRSIQCSYCYEEGHNKRHCPKLKAQYLANKDWNRYSSTPPVGVSADMFPTPYQRFWSDNRAIDCFRNHFDYAKGVHGEKPTTAPRPRRKSKCGFCGKRIIIVATALPCRVLSRSWRKQIKHTENYSMTMLLMV
jgi:hypothetical protein